MNVPRFSTIFGKISIQYKLLCQIEDRRRRRNNKKKPKTHHQWAHCPFCTNKTIHEYTKPSHGVSEIGVKEFDQPAKSPDLNHTELLWDELDWRLQAGPSRPTSVSELINSSGRTVKNKLSHLCPSFCLLTSLHLMDKDVLSCSSTL